MVLGYLAKKASNAATHRKTGAHTYHQVKELKKVCKKRKAFDKELKEPTRGSSIA